MKIYNNLYHYGIKGMHWGVRRYQNEDGTYTRTGKYRRNKTEKSNEMNYSTDDDVVLKKGTSLYRISKSKVENASDRSYYSLNPEEYINDYFVDDPESTYRHEYKLNRDIVIAGYNTTSKILSENGNKPLRVYGGSRNNNNMTDPDFNMDRSGPYRRFRETALNKGYSGIVDPEDSFSPAGGGMSMTPTILYTQDVLKKVGTVKVSTLY